jgi:hypothetical protein
MKTLRAMGVALLLVGCASGSGGGGGDFWMDYYYYDSWYYGGGCCVDPPDVAGPIPHPEHPIVLPPGGDGPRPSQPIANNPTPRAAPVSRPMPAPRAAARGGGGRR